MKTITTAFIGFLFTFIFSLQADPSPQDSWYLDREVKLPEMPGFRKPLGITIDSTGKSYVVDQSNHTITVWDQMELSFAGLALMAQETANCQARPILK